MARRTTRSKSPTANASDKAKSEPTRASDTHDPVEAEKAQSAKSADLDASEATEPSKTPEPQPVDETQSATSEKTVATAEEAQLAKDITPPEATTGFEEIAADNSVSGQNADPQPETAGTEPEATDKDPDLAATSPEVSVGSDSSEPIEPKDQAKPDNQEPNRSEESAPIRTDRQPQPRKSGFFPMLLGGVVAGGIGFGAAYLGLPQQTADPLDEISLLRNEIAGLRAELDAVPPPTDVSALEDELAQLRGQIGSADQADLGPLQARLDDMSDGLSQQVDTVAEELGSLRAALAEAEEQIAALGADMADLRDLGERRVSEAEAAVDVALAQSGLDSVRAALETGAPYADAVSRLEGAGVRVPEALAAPSANGIPTLEALQEGFPQAARAALRVALHDAPAESTVDRLGNFLRAQIGARSTAPRQGDDADAVLSRAGAALEAGDLETTLAEIQALPEPAQAAMGDWLNAAQARVAARDALPELINAISTE